MTGQEELTKLFKNSKYVQDGEMPIQIELPKDEYMESILAALSTTKPKKEKSAKTKVRQELSG